MALRLYSHKLFLKRYNILFVAYVAIRRGRYVSTFLSNLPTNPEYVVLTPLIESVGFTLKSSVIIYQTARRRISEERYFYRPHLENF
jgi:hypothetical protein